MIRTLTTIIRTLTTIIRTLSTIIRTLTSINRTLTTSIRTLRTIIRTLPAPFAGPSHAFVRAHAWRRAAWCRAGSTTSAGSTHAAARTRSRPSGGRRCGFGPSVLLPHPRRDWAHSLPHYGWAWNGPAASDFGGCAWQMCARDAPALSAHAELEASFKNELAQLESQVDGLQKCAPPFRPHLRRIDRSAAAAAATVCSALRQVQGVHAGLARAARPAHELARGAGAPNPVPAQMWEGWAQSQRRCGRGGPSPGAYAARIRIVRALSAAAGRAAAGSTAPSTCAGVRRNRRQCFPR